MIFLRSLLLGIQIVRGVADATPKLHTNHPRDHADEQCDYIVVGGGTAVCVIEAGGFYEQDANNKTTVPGYASYGSSSDPLTAGDTPETDWGFVTQKQVELKNNTFHYVRGRTLGGSSAVNLMVYHRGNAQAYDKWAEDVGDDSYSWANFLPYFRKSAKYTAPNTNLRAANATVPAPSAQAYSSSGGPLQVSHPNWAPPISSFAEAAFSSIGIPPLQDVSSGKMFGAQYIPLTIDPSDEKRSSSEASYLQYALASGRSNLRVFTKTLAKKIVFDGKTATGVIVMNKNGTTSTLIAKKEVILSAGAFQSPQLLMVSGIGPSSALKELGIEVLVDRPGVGQGMWDHVTMSLIQQVDVETLSALSDAAKALKAAQDYNKTHSGPLANNGADYIGWEKVPTPQRSNLTSNALADLSTFPADWPEVELLIGALPIPGVVGANYGLIAGNLVAPLSRGYVAITSNDTSDPPLINPNYLSHATDQGVAVQIFKRMRQLLNADAFKPILIGDEIAPGLSVQTDEQILESLRASASPAYHAACTCEFPLYTYGQC
ncbi:gmc oxidoreductase protein [Rutstroemia sp. NJR-2017a BBW]|nr:gmc oxidoreductase protein [Rutstroemia sp. NJR-2017a BBW]